MKNDLSSYFEEPEFIQLLKKYEGMVKNHTHLYFDTDDLTDLADYYIYIGKEEEADKVMEYSLQLHPNNTDALIYKVRKLYFSGNKEEAYKLLGKIENPADREVMFLKAELLIEEKKYFEAELVYQELAETEGESLNVLRDITICYMDTNNKKYARKWLSKIESKGYNQGNSQIYRDLWCDYCMLNGQPADAIQAFQKSVDEYPYSIKYWNGFARCYLELFDYPKAHEAVDFSLAIDYTNQEARELKAFCYMHEENYEEAVKIYEQILHTEPKDKKRLYNMLAQCHTSMGIFNVAIKYYLLWLKDYPHTSNYEKSEIYSYIAMCYCNLGIPEKGLKYINAALQLDPLFCGAMIQKATLCLQMNDSETANGLFQKAQDICPYDEREDILYNIASSYFFLKQYDKVIEWCKKVMSEFPQTPEKGIVLCTYSYFEMEDYDSGLLYLMEAIRLCKEGLDENKPNGHLIQKLIMDIKERYANLNLDNLN